MPYNQNPTEPPLETIPTEITGQKNIRLELLRLDKMQTGPAGNKWFKLKHNLRKAREMGYNKLITFGGPWSNHIYATALAGKHFSFETIGIIRGEKPEALSDTLQFAADCGMQLKFISRSQYRQKNNTNFLETLKEKFGPCYILPEGGTNALAVEGTAEIPGLIPGSFDFICCPCGTGGTLAGIASGLTGSGAAIGFPVLKNEEELKKVVEKYVGGTQWSLAGGYHCGGFAKINNELTAFMQAFEANHKIPLEPLYSAKMLYGLMDLIGKNRFSEGSRIIALHTGGLQGKAGMLPSLEKYGYQEPGS